MIISEFIEHLEKLKELHGDVEVKANDQVGSFSSFKETEVYGYSARGIRGTEIIIDI